MRISTPIFGKYLYLQNRKNFCILYKLLFPRHNEYKPWYCWKLGYYTEGSAYNAFYEQNVLPYLAHLWRTLVRLMPWPSVVTPLFDPTPKLPCPVRTQERNFLSWKAVECYPSAGHRIEHRVFLCAEER
jgi:hypothetical protein